MITNAIGHKWYNCAQSLLDKMLCEPHKKDTPPKLMQPVVSPIPNIRTTHAMLLWNPPFAQSLPSSTHTHIISSIWNQAQFQRNLSTDWYICINGTFTDCPHGKKSQEFPDTSQLHPPRCQVQDGN